MSIPFVDLKKQYRSIKAEIDVTIQNVINETAFIKGKYVAQFEDDYKQVYGVKHVISCANGTDAIYITLKALGIGPGDEVITVANTWISTAETISQTGAKPVFIDIDPDYYTIDASKIEEKITKKTKAIIPVHLFGQPADMDAITELCKQYGLFLIEDCAQAHFAEWNGKKVGTFGNAGTFSFFPGKNLGAYGDAGAIVTNDSELAEKMRMFANHGALKKHFHEIEGINSRMDGIQAAILSVKLKYIVAWSEARYLNALKYHDYLQDINGIIVPKIRRNVKHVFHLYVIKVNNRSLIQEKLKEANISSGIHYPTPLPFLNAYKYLNHTPIDFPISYECKDKILSLPMYPELSEQQIKHIATQLNSSVFKTK
jgi:dTDP-4-amino-4,6-dideoxygalactose transaminase